MDCLLSLAVWLSGGSAAIQLLYGSALLLLYFVLHGVTSLVCTRWFARSTDYRLLWSERHNGLQVGSFDGM